MHSAESARLELMKFLIGELARRMEVDPNLIDPRVPFDRYGVDSLNAIRLAADLEERIDRRIPSTALWDYPSIEALAAYLANDLNVRGIRPLRVATPEGG
jgi:8-amino-7-oxononanoate synthase